MGRQEKELPKWLMHVNKTKEKNDKGSNFVVYIFLQFKTCMVNGNELNTI